MKFSLAIVAALATAAAASPPAAAFSSGATSEKTGTASSPTVATSQHTETASHHIEVTSPETMDTSPETRSARKARKDKTPKHPMPPFDGTINGHPVDVNSPVPRAPKCFRWCLSIAITAVTPQCVDANTWEGMNCICLQENFLLLAEQAAYCTLSMCKYDRYHAQVIPWVEKVCNVKGIMCSPPLGKPIPHFPKIDGPIPWNTSLLNPPKNSTDGK